MSVRDALEAYSQRMIADTKKKKSKKNKKPEFEVVKACMLELDSLGFSMDKVEAKAVFSHKAGMYLSGPVVAGFPDACGCTPTGIGCFIEFKSWARKTMVSDGQRKFLRTKILKGCFALVVYDLDQMKKDYYKWNELYVIDKEKAVAYLLNLLPPEKVSRGVEFDLF